MRGSATPTDPLDPRRRATRAALGVAVVAAGLAVAPALARPVRPGRFVEIPHGLSPAHPWPGDGGGARRAGRARHPLPAEAPTPLFETPLPDRPQGDLVVVEGGRVHVAHGDAVTALGGDGRRLWSVAVGAPDARRRPRVRDLALLPGRRLVATFRRGPIRVVDAMGAGLLAERALGSGSRWAPLVLDDGSLVGVSGGVPLERRGPDGERLFAVHMPFHASGPPALGRGPSIVVATRSALLRYDLEGRALGAVPLPDRPVGGAAVADDGSIWVATAPDALHVFDAEGAPRGRASLGGRPLGRPALAPDGSARIGVADVGVVAVGPAGGHRWTFARPGFGRHVVVDPGGATLATGPRGGLVALERDGAVRWELAPGAAGPVPLVPPVVAPGGRILLGTRRPSVRALGPGG